MGLCLLLQLGHPAPALRSPVSPVPFPQRDALEKGIPTVWDVRQGKNIKWTAKLGSKCYTRPVVAGGKVFIGTNNGVPRNAAIQGDKGVLLCLRESDGQLLWQAVHEPTRLLFRADYPAWGICSAPAVEGKRLYYVSSAFELICADIEGFLDGKNDGVQDEKYRGKTDADFLWRIDLKKELGIDPTPPATCTPVLAGGRLFLITGNGTNEGGWLSAPQAPSFVAVDKQTGKLLWKNNDPSKQVVNLSHDRKDFFPLLSERRDRGRVILHGQWSSPVYALVNGQPQIIFAGGDGWVRGYVPATGKLIWEFDANPKDAVYRIGGSGTRNYFVASPVVHENRLYIGVGQDPEHGEGVGHLWCLNLLPTVSEEGRPRAPEVAWHFGGQRGPTDADASKRPYIFGRTVSTCAVQDGLVYAADLRGFLYCLEASSGRELWYHDLGDTVSASPFLVDGKVYLGNWAGQMYVFAQGRQKRLLQTNEMETQILNSPAVANGVLYLPTATHLFAISHR